MTTERRRKAYIVRPDGTRWNEQVYRELIGAWDRRAPRRIPVERLSAKDPSLQIEGRR